MRLGYKELGLKLVEPLQNISHKSRQATMVDETKDEGQECKISYWRSTNYAIY